MSLAFTTSPTPPSLSFNSNNNGVFFFNNKFQTTSSNRRSRRRGVFVKASNTSVQRKTLASNWEIPNSSSITPSPLFLPRFDDLDPGSMLLRQRIIFLGSQVDDVSADFIISQLLLLDAQDQNKDITFFINSPGGSVTAGMGIYDTMKLIKADVSTVCFGLAASMGAFLLCAGTKGKRYCMPNSKVMIHQPLGTAGGKATDFSIRIREMAYHKLKLIKIMSKCSGKSEQQIEEDTDRDNFLNPWEAMEYGLVDAVIDDGKPGLVAPIADATPPPKTRVSEYWKIEGSRKGKKNLPSENKLLELFGGP